MNSTTSEDEYKYHYNIEAASMIMSNKSSIYTPKIDAYTKKFQNDSELTDFDFFIHYNFNRSRLGSSVRRSWSRMHVPHKLDDLGDNPNSVNFLDHIDFRDWNECAGHYHEYDIN